MRTVRIGLALGLLGAAAAAQAEVSATVTAVSDYDFRGVSLSAKDPALQASVDWSGESGFYVGAWASNIDYGEQDGDIELDLYAGFAGETEAGLGWDAGIVYYTYPDSDDKTVDGEVIPKIEAYPEIYLGLSYNVFELKQWYTNDYVGSDVDALYTEGNASFELPAGFGLNLHLGYNYGDAFDGFEYVDYSVGVGYTLGNFALELKYTGTDLSGEDKITDDVFNTEGRVLFSVSTTFPWAAE